MSVEYPPIYSRKGLFQWTKSFLRKYNIKPKDRLSQSFLINPKMLYEIGYWLEKLSVNRNETICEIGSGIGIITYYLVMNEYKVLAIDIDSKLVNASYKLFKRFKRVVLINADALEIPFNCNTIVSNTPFHISSQLLLKIARSNNVSRAILVFQKDVVERIVAKPGTKEYGRLSIIMQQVFDLKRGSIYSPSSFYPKPKVSTQLIVLVRKNEYGLLHYKLEEITRVLFTERRKKALSVISRKLGLSKSAIKELGIDDKVRVYQLSPEIFVKIASYMRDSL